MNKLRYAIFPENKDQGFRIRDRGLSIKKIKLEEKIEIKHENKSIKKCNELKKQTEHIIRPF